VYDVAGERDQGGGQRRVPRGTTTRRCRRRRSEADEQFFDDMMALGVEGMMLSPGYSYQKAPDQEHFLQRQKRRSSSRNC